MNFILDTHTIIWFSENNPQLSDRAKDIISEADNDCFVSFVSIWEMAIKIKLDKLILEIELKDFIHELISRDFKLLEIKVDHLLNTMNLPFHHRDPFDRLLISQSQTEDIPIITKDYHFNNYNIQVIW